MKVGKEKSRASDVRHTVVTPAVYQRTRVCGTTTDEIRFEWAPAAHRAQREVVSRVSRLVSRVLFALSDKIYGDYQVRSGASRGE